MRTYEKTHSWIRFDVDMRAAPPRLWILLGEARSKCDHLSSIALRPDFAELLRQLYLAKGVAATTAIEGNTLTEDQVRQRLEGALELPPSQEYLGREIDNVVTATNRVWDQVRSSGFSQAQVLSVDEICELNRIVLEGTQFADYVTPGRIRTTLPVGVGSYQGAPAEDCQFLLEQFCAWLNNWHVDASPDTGVIPAIIKAICAHVTFEWIHPFGDGNGRVGRLIEFKILVAGGVPTVAAHLLSNHYNLTRSRYYLELSRASKTADGMLGFLIYAVEGFVDQLVQQIDLVLAQQFTILWSDMIHQSFRDQKSVTRKRQRDVALAISDARRVVPLREIPTLTRELALQYAKLTDRTLMRDLAELKRMKLIKPSDAGYKANVGIILANLSMRRTEVESRYLRDRDDTTLESLTKQRTKGGQPEEPEDMS